MAFFIRKFDQAKWDSSVEAYIKSGKDKKCINGDTFSKCLFTTGNTLSVWHSETSNWDEITNLLAVIFSASDGPSRSDIIIINETDLAGIDITNEIGGAPVNIEYNKLHRNFSNINYESMGYVAERIATIIMEDCEKEESVRRYRRFSEKKVESIVKKAADIGIIDLEKARLKERWARRFEPTT
ncbi:hypothetical protein [Aeromonas hydrophila]|uniref:hypothetical protein n=1 Tax=Aeromonas hydrophila TaxID=644 RepID=UPI00191DD36E|nr:hypothetical protein [Aeromonas hydrophila]MBL0559284.1 hypothetical protein [Aeromonas hydrophila]